MKKMKMSRIQNFTKENLLQDGMIGKLVADSYDDDEKDLKGDTCPWCTALVSLSLFCPIKSASSSKVKQSNSKERNYLGTPLPESPIEVRRKRRLLEGLLEAEESVHNFDSLNLNPLAEIRGQASLNIFFLRSSHFKTDFTMFAINILDRGT